MSANRHIWIWASLALCVVAFEALARAGSASALTPAWSVYVASEPTNLPPGGEGQITLEAVNLGDAPASASSEAPVALSDILPAGLTATKISGEVENGSEGFSEGEVSCELAALRCTDGEGISPFGRFLVKVSVQVAAGLSGRLTNEAHVVGGGAPGAAAREEITVNSSPAAYGVEKLQLLPTNENGAVDTQAGSHPFQLTTTIGLSTDLGEIRNNQAVVPSALTKDLHFALPAGLIGNPQVLPQCSEQDFAARLVDNSNGCPAETAIGVATVFFASWSNLAYTVPLFNLVPSVGEPARFGFEILDVPVVLDTSLRTGGDYGVVVTVHDIQQALPFAASRVTFWGVPGAAAHDQLRGWDCVGHDRFALHGCTAPPQSPPVPFLTLPTSCPGPGGMRSTVTADSWAQPAVFQEGEYTLQGGGGEPLGLDGCNRLPFDPSISVAPDGQAASTPTGLTVGVHVPQEAGLNPTGLAPADLRDTTVTLPEGVQISPAGAGGLQACSLGQIGLEVDASPACPEASKVGTAEVKTPLLPAPLEGAVYLAAQDANPFGSLVALYIVVEDPTAGVLVKFAGKVSLNPATGQLVSTFENTPQLPFEDLKLHFFGSARAPLSTPALCGSYTTQASFTPWSGETPAEPSSTFQITSGPNGAPCADPQPFAPVFQAGSSNIQAGAFTPFTMTMTRPDADQTLAGITLNMPAGLSGDLSHVELCPEPQASTGACPTGSLIGHTVVSAGLGGSPFTVEGGQVFITGPYKGAPFGLSILNPAQAGPFDLGQVVVRAKIEVDPTTAALRIVSDPLPTILDGIPLQIQHINVTVDRTAFTFNPTSCDPMSLTGTITSTQGATAAVSTPFQVTNCATLAFKPGFAASTSGRTSRADGASLEVKLTYPNAPAGSQANIARVKVQLPKALPSRLTTLQKACPEAAFDTSPEACPAGSRVGEATATTPILAGGLAGPAYFVSHGGAKFPELVVVLRGEDGVTVELHGETFISTKGITSSTFASVPDVPVGSFELKLPQGPYSALAANGNLCQEKLTMPTEFVAQNGVVKDQATKIQVTGCPKTKHASHRGKRGHRAHHPRSPKHR
jgi:hypothetical protein